MVSGPAAADGLLGSFMPPRSIFRYEPPKFDTPHLEGWRICIPEPVALAKLPGALWDN
jgi:hypothetical protein